MRARSGLKEPKRPIDSINFFSPAVVTLVG
jgi:hypothetical protein